MSSSVAIAATIPSSNELALERNRLADERT
jgi:hypothetical protein